MKLQNQQTPDHYNYLDEWYSSQHQYQFQTPSKPQLFQFKVIFVYAQFYFDGRF